MKRNYYHLAILAFFLIGSLALSVSAAEQASLTIYVHEGDLNGTLLPDVDVTGQDATGNNFESITDSNGLVTISGQPGTWQFTFAKEGYDTLNLYYNVTETDEAAAYIQKATQSDEQTIQADEQTIQSNEQTAQSIDLVPYQINQ